MIKTLLRLAVAPQHQICWLFEWLAGAVLNKKNAAVPKEGGRLSAKKMFLIFEFATMMQFLYHLVTYGHRPTPMETPDLGWVLWVLVFGRLQIGSGFGSGVVLLFHEWTQLHCASCLGLQWRMGNLAIYHPILVFLSLSEVGLFVILIVAYFPANLSFLIRVVFAGL